MGVRGNDRDNEVCPTYPWLRKVPFSEKPADEFTLTLLYFACAFFFKVAIDITGRNVYVDIYLPVYIFLRRANRCMSGKSKFGYNEKRVILDCQYVIGNKRGNLNSIQSIDRLVAHNNIMLF